MNVYKVIKEFDKIYYSFRLDVSQMDESGLIKVLISFYIGRSTEEHARQATRDLYAGMHHQIRPFGKSLIEDDPSKNNYNFISYFDSHKISDTGAKRLMTKIISFAEEVATLHGIQ